jgi:hypothetical protein
LLHKQLNEEALCLRSLAVATKFPGTVRFALRRSTSRAVETANSLDGLNTKTMVLAIAHDAFDDPGIWNEPLQKSISRDIVRMAPA